MQTQVEIMGAHLVHLNVEGVGLSKHILLCSLVFLQRDTNLPLTQIIVKI